MKTIEWHFLASQFRGCLELAIQRGRRNQNVNINVKIQKQYIFRPICKMQRQITNDIQI